MARIEIMVWLKPVVLVSLSACGNTLLGCPLFSDVYVETFVDVTLGVRGEGTGFTT